MESETRRRIEAIFDASRDRAAGADRQAFLDGACGDDAELRSRVDALLAAHDEAGGFLEGPAIQGSKEGPGSSIGVYRLLQQIGEGGMGVVYMAEQEKPVRRKVALKVIKLGMDTKRVIARFEAERQALAMMDHAHIARVLDAGSTETGRPYFVMELVRGVPINEYCDTHKLSTSERLGLFVEVCRAVQHAHQKGVIHRDIKPTNVLVSSHDGTPVPKIIDFGVAKATNHRLTERTLFTEFHQIIGTPEYMSPEQAEMSGLDVDTRSDIYSLGVLLYQLLTGTTPVDPTELRTAGFEEMTRMIREEEPPAPSTRISKLGAAGEKIARHRSSDAGSLSRHFRGDLDWIVMKALEKDRTRRYETASAFAEDVRRHLEDLPVEAGRPGTWYRLNKFAHRNRKAVLAMAVLLAVIGLGLAGTTAGFLRANAEADRSGRISASLQDVLAMTHSGNSADRQNIEGLLATVRELFGQDHATFAAVLDALSQRLHDAGDFDAAVSLGQEALEVWKNVYGEQHPNVATTLAHVGTALRARGDEQEAEKALRAALTSLDGASDAPGQSGYEARIELADLLANRGEYAEADALIGEALTLLRTSPAPAHFRIIETLERRVALQLSQPDGDAREMLREIYEEANAFYPQDSPMLALCALGLGRHLSQHEQYEAAEPFLREAVERFRASPTPPPVYLFGAADGLLQVIRNRTDAASAEEVDGLLRDLIHYGRGFMDADQRAGTQKYYGNRMLERGLLEEGLYALLDAYETLVEAGRPADERDSLRGDLVQGALRFALEPNRDPTTLASVRDGLELALRDERDSDFVAAALGAILFRLGEYEPCLATLDPLLETLGRSPRGAKIAPVLHAFRALALGSLGHGEVARGELQALRTALDGAGAGPEAQAILSEVEALLEHTILERGWAEPLVPSSSHGASMTTSRLSLCLLASLALSHTANAGDQPTLEERLAKLSEGLEAARKEAHIPGMSIAVVKGGEVVLTRGFGLADVADGRPSDENTIYAIGSTTKAFTATLLGMLVDEGKVSWDDPVTRHLPYFELQVRSDDEKAECTLRDLLSHRHGFARMSILWFGSQVSREEILRTATGAEPWDDFRANFHYCNVAYLAAGEAAGRAAGSTWDEMMAARLFEPLGMTASTLSTSATEEDPRMALGYKWIESGESLEQERRIPLDNIGPAGSVSSSALDMAQWLRLLLGRGEVDGIRLISSERLLDTWAPQIEIAAGVSYGLGWMLREHDGRKVVEHGGNIDGFSAQVGLIPEEDLGYVLLMNLSGAPLQQASIPLVFDALLDEWPESRSSGPGVVADSAELEGYVGTYIANFGSFHDAEFQVALEDDHLVLQIPNQTPSALEPPNEEGLWVSALSSRVAVSFQRGAQDGVVGLTIHQGEYRFEVPREGVEIAPAEPVEGLEKYAGTYARANGGRRDRITIEDGGLVYVDGKQRIPLNPPDATGFSSLRFRADHGPTFEMDAEGTVVSYVFRGEAGAQLFRRVADSKDLELPTLEEVLALRRVDARIEAIEKGGGTRLRGTAWVAQAGVRGTITVHVRGGDRYASHLDFGKFGRIDAVVKGGEAWSYNSLQGLEALEGEELAQALLAHPNAVEGDWRDYFDSLEVVRSEQLNERPTHVIRLEKDGLPSRTYWIDAEHGDVLRTKQSLLDGTARIPVTITYSDFEERGGIRRPMWAEVQNPASGRTVLSFEEFQSGLELGDETFTLEAPAPHER